MGRLTMADLIDRQALLEKIQYRLPIDNKNRKIIAGCVDITRRIIEAEPGVDLIRCADCKRWLKDFVGCTEHVGRCEWAGYMVGANGYCVYGERREA